jgi:hypothetical protein
VLQSHVLVEHVAHTERREKPVLYAVLLQHLLVADIVSIPVLPVTIDNDTEHIENGITMAVESGA